MDILLSLHKKWAEMILNGDKTLEFRNRLGKEFKVGSKIFIYETSKNNGCKKIVGEFTIKDIKEISKSDLGCYPFLAYYYENLEPDIEILEAIKKIYSIKMDHYKDSIKISYIFLPEVLENLNKTGKLPNLLSMPREEFIKYCKLQDKSEEVIDKCDDWLRSIGYYNEYDESFYKYYIEISNPIKYDTPLELNSFLDKDNNPINKAPQSFMYCRKP